MTSLERLAKGRFLVLGRAGMDLYADPPGSHLAEARRFEAHLGGSAANIAAALSRQGCRAGLLTKVSDDAVGRFVLNALADYAIDARHVSVVGGGLRTSLAVVETRLEDCQSVIYRNGAADFALSCEDVEQVDFSQVDALVVTGTALADPDSRAATMLALTRARAAGAVAVMDIDHRPYSWTSDAEAQAAYLAAARHCDIVVGNDVEFGLIGGGHALGLNAARDLARVSGGIAVYKMGEHGSVTIWKDKEVSLGIFRVEALKPTGAGDAFMGGFLAGLARGVPIRDAVIRGSAAAAIVVARVGCAPASPTTEELDAFLANRPEPD